MFPEENFTTNGTLSEFSHVSDLEKTTTHFFCTRCGSPIYAKNSEMVGFVTFSVGTLDDPNLVEPQVVVFAKHRSHWDMMDSALETFNDMPDWKPE